MQARRQVWGVLAVVGALVAGVTGVLAAPPPAAAQTTEPTVGLTPASDFVDGTAVTIAVGGLPANTWVQGAQCAADAESLYSDDCDYLDGAYGRSDAAGAATLSLRLDAVIRTGFDEPQEFDCREHGACVIALSTNDGETVAAKAALHFVADAPLAPPPTLTVTPDDDLTDLQTVSLEGDGLVWSERATVIQCAADPADRQDCDYETYLDVDARTGSFTSDYTVSTVISTTRRGVVDCREADNCVLTLSQDYLRSTDKSAIVPLAFDPDGEVIVPTLTVTPHEDLIDGQQVTIEGSGFRGSWVELALCGPELTWDTCQWLDTFPELDDTGSFTVEVDLFALIVTDTGEIDCRTSADPCLLVAHNGSLTSPRAGRAELHFDPDGPLLPGPQIEVDPSTNLPAQATVTVTGSSFTPFGYPSVRVCKADDLSLCDPQSRAELRPDRNGNFTVGLGVAATFQVQFGDGEGEEPGPTVDCRTAPGCVVAAYDSGPGRRRTTAPLSFAPPVDLTKRYFDPIFDVDITHDVVYRDTVDSQGNPVQLKLDIYEPAGDTAAKRPAVMWMDGGWFAPAREWDPNPDMSGYADAFARRGYVAVTMEYRQRPELACCPTRDAVGIANALLDGYDDAAAGVAWLKAHAADYRIDPQAIAAGGASAGAANAFSLAYLPGQMDRQGPSGIAAALPISGVSLGTPDPGEPPVLAFHGTQDNRAPQHLSDWTCDAADRADTRCAVVGYQGSYNDIFVSRQRDIVRRSADFLAEVVLTPLGYFPPHEHPTTTSTTSSSTTSTTAMDHGRHGGDLPRTGSNSTLGLIRLGLALASAGGVLLLVARHRRRLTLPVPGDRGDVRIAGPVLLGLAVFTALVVPTVAGAQEDPPHEHPTTTVPGETTTSSPTTSSSSTTSTTMPGTTTSSTPGATTSTMPPGHGHEDPPPEWQFPPDWTPEQVEQATMLIHDTEASLERYKNMAILPLLGFQWIHDGNRVEEYQHWINTSWIVDQNAPLDVNFPESLVFRNTAEGPVLEAAMYMLGLGFNLDNVPDDIKFFPGWHIHDNLCFEGFVLVGIAVNGVCERGSILPTPPMLHVWIVDTRCGRFAGVDEHGLQCHHHDG